ncbi:MAG: alpha-amylase [Myxococcales bacterium]|jgi:glycosidase|nr:alpha-amylase [Myxococcales bacterium]
MDRFHQTQWVRESIFYHLYPLGACGAPERNQFEAPVEFRLARLFDWIPHWRALGVNALLIGPVFESSAHGYDTVDLFRIDRRIGDWALFRRFSQELKAAGIRLFLDGVFHHVGRDFWAFRDVRDKRWASPYRDWFSGLNFDRPNRHGDGFIYDTWNGCDDLVKLNLGHPKVRQHLFSAVEAWMRDFDISGLRLDAADSIDPGFLSELARFCRRLRPDFFLMGEVVHGDYRCWANPERLDSTTNYECFKSLHSSFNDKNLFEIAYSLRRQFGPQGLYSGLPLYSFADNHDVNRVASLLKDRAHLWPLYLLLFTMPGVPSIYYGSEWGMTGERTRDGDRALRPVLPDSEEAFRRLPEPNLAQTLRQFSQLRLSQRALREGDYQEVFVRSEQFGFSRTSGGEKLLILINSSAAPANIELPEGPWRHATLVDLLETSLDAIRCGERLSVTIPANGGRVLRVG